MQRKHKNGHLSSHYPCDECEHTNLLNAVEHLGVTWTIQNLSGQTLIEALEHQANEILKLVKIERSLL